MARLLRVCLPGVPQHIIQRGNNHQVCFASGDDFAAYASWLEEYAGKTRVDIHTWVFMTNHVHLLATPSTEDGISRLMQSLGRRYVRYFNYTYRRSGTLWEGRFKSCVVNAERYLLACQRYIELNPVRAGMVEVPADYSWSSYHANGLGMPVSMWRPHPVYQGLAVDKAERLAAYRELFNAHVDEVAIDQIRQATNKGLALGSDRFKREVEQLTGRRVTEMRRGPKGKEFLL